jgi:hypothetical protein
MDKACTQSIATVTLVDFVQYTCSPKYLPARRNATSSVPGARTGMTHISDLRSHWSASQKRHGGLRFGNGRQVLCIACSVHEASGVGGGGGRVVAGSLGICRCMYGHAWYCYCFSPHNRSISVPRTITPQRPAHAFVWQRTTGEISERALVAPSLADCSKRPQVRDSCVATTPAEQERDSASKERDRRPYRAVLRLRQASSPPNVPLFLSLRPPSSTIFFASTTHRPPSDFNSVRLGLPWAHLRPPTASPRTRGTRPTIVPRSTPSSPTHTRTLPSRPLPRVCSRRGAQMSTPRCWPASKEKLLRLLQARKTKATTSETSTMRITGASRRALGT